MFIFVSFPASFLLFGPVVAGFELKALQSFGRGATHLPTHSTLCLKILTETFLFTFERLSSSFSIPCLLLFINRLNVLT